MAVVHEQDCPFCLIANGAGDAEVVYRGEAAIAFSDRNPINPGHVLVIPYQHEPDFEELDAEQLSAVMTVVQRVSKVIKSIYAPKKMGVAVAGFDVAHAHVHVIPLHDYHDLTSKRLLEGTLGRASADVLAREGTAIRNGLSTDVRGSVSEIVGDSRCE